MCGAYLTALSYVTHIYIYIPFYYEKVMCEINKTVHMSKHYSFTGDWHTKIWNIFIYYKYIFGVFRWFGRARNAKNKTNIVQAIYVRFKNRRFVIFCERSVGETWGFCLMYHAWCVCRMYIVHSRIFVFIESRSKICHRHTKELEKNTWNRMMFYCLLPLIRRG